MTSSAPGPERRGIISYFPHVSSLPAAYGIDGASVPPHAASLHDVLLASVKPLPPVRGCVSGALPPPHSQVAVMRHVTRTLITGHTTWHRPKHMLARGYRIAAAHGGLEMRHVNAEAEYLCAAAWQWLLECVGPQRMVAMLTCPHTVVLRRLANDNFQQLSGIALDEFLRPAATPASQQAATTPAPSPCANPTPHPTVLPLWRGVWELPRADLKQRPHVEKSTLGPIITQPGGGGAPRLLVQVCKRLYHGATSFPLRAGLEDEHIFNVALRMRPAAAARKAQPHKMKASVSSHAAMECLREPAAGQVAADAAASAVARRLQQVAWRHALSTPAPPERHAPPVTSSNAARRVLQHIFQHAPHLQDVCLLNEGSAGARVWMATHTCTGASTDARTPAAPAPTDSVPLPASLRACVPVFHDLLERHRHLPYAVVLERHCPQSPASKHPTARVAVATASHFSERQPSLEASAASASMSTTAPTLRPLDVVVPHESVMAFVREVLQRLLPAALWGSSATHRHILALVWRWISAGVSDKLFVADVLAGLRSSDFTVFTPGRHAATGVDARTRHAVTWVLWLLLGLVTPLLRAHFYVTTSEVHHHVTLYYRKPVWARLTRAATLSLIEQLELRRVHAAELLTTLRSHARRDVGVARVKLVPKRAAMRPIMNLASATQLSMDQVLTMQARDAVVTEARAGTKRTREAASSVQPRLSGPALKALLGAEGRLEVKPINKVLQPLLEVLRRQRRAHPHATGAATFGLDGTHAALRHFRSVTAPGPRRPLHIVTCDVRAAYDNIDQKLALECMQALLPVTEPSFVLRTFVVARVERGPPERVRLRFMRVASAPAELESFTEFAQRLAHMFRGAVFVDMVENQRVEREDLMLLLAHHVCAHIVQLARHRFYLQQHGIPQGSSLSSLLCNVYLGHMEHALLVPALRACAAESTRARTPTAIPAAGAPGTVLLRLTDDFVCMSDSHAVVNTFAALMHAGIPKYHMSVSASKTSSSVALEVDDTAAGHTSASASGAAAGCESPSQRVRIQPAVAADARGAYVTVKWCGIQMHAGTGHLDSDYDRYAGVGAVRESVSMNVGSSVIRALARMLVAFMRPKCHPVFFDSMLHSPFAAAWNVYELAGLAAVKCACVMNFVLDRRRGHAPAATRQLWPHVYDALHRAERSLWDMIQHRANVASAGPHPFFPHPPAMLPTSDALIVGSAAAAAASLPPCRFPLRRAESSWVFFRAFIDVLQRAGGRFQPLTDALVRTSRRAVVEYPGAPCAAPVFAPRVRAEVMAAARVLHPQVRSMSTR